jgi:hypothetical protein
LNPNCIRELMQRPAQGLAIPRLDLGLVGELADRLNYWPLIKRA